MVFFGFYSMSSTSYESEGSESESVLNSDNESQSAEEALDTFPSSLAQLEVIDILPEGFPEISKKWRTPVLYKTNHNDSTFVWVAEFNGKYIITYNGTEHGKKKANKVEVTTNSTKRDLKTQAYIRARRNFVNKIKVGWRPRITLENFDLDDIPVLQPMMSGHPYKAEKITKWPVIVQDKKDGIRGRILIIKDEVAILSKKNRPIEFLPQIRKQARSLLKLFPKGTQLDVELYSDVLPYNLIQKAVMGTKNCHSYNKYICAYILDVILPQGALPYEKRYNMIRNNMISCEAGGNKLSAIKLVYSKLAHNYEQIDELFNDAIATGNEGIIIRFCSWVFKRNSKEYKLSLYLHTRCWNFMKLKPEDDAEGKIVDVERMTGTQGDCAKFIVKKDNKTFPVVMRGTLEQRRKWFENKHKYIGRKLTYKYQGIGPKGLPRFPVGLRFRRLD